MKRPGSKKFGTKRVIGLVLAMGILSAATYAFTNTNTVTAAAAGEGKGTISGYTASDVDYTFNTATDPATITAYTFTLNQNATMVKASLDGGLNFDDCAVVATVVTCTTSLLDPPTVAEAVSLRVIASNDANPLT
ncbi:MAG TPA: hypothetical protein VJ927_00710 [Actinomycetota bacterium]|nr:hypothetical protein [Actinomycetota bacterium]